MHAVRAVCAFVLVVSASAVSAKVRTVSDQDKLQAACYADVQRLCKDEIPDEGKITLCMEGKKSMISSGCIKAYDATQAE